MVEAVGAETAESYGYFKGEWELGQGGAGDDGKEVGNVGREWGVAGRSVGLPW